MNTEHTELMVVGQQGKAGRPTKYSPETVDRLLAGLADGLSYKSACITAGIGVSTLADWREKYPELEVRMEEAREVARRGAFRKAFAHARGPCQGLSLKPYARAWH
jgi:hypothetical protein